ncbi:MAG TPA: hypothetical protein VGH73_10300 [Thermoanaerobaculia bacterium]|jgi:hypothetical protein
MHKVRIHKLGLSKETLRLLDGDELGGAHGGQVARELDTVARSEQTACCPTQGCPVQT